MKKIVKSICILMVIMTLSACKGGLYMDDFADVQWTCSEIDMQFEYTSDNREMAIGTLVKGDETINIVCKFTLYKNIEVYDESEYDSTTSDDVRTPLLIGSYSIEGDIATVEIIQDNLYNGEYLDKEIHLTKTPIE